MKALITGASRGIGAAVATRLGLAGWETKNLSRTSGVDVRDAIKVRNEIDRFRPDVLVYSAGVVYPRPFVAIGESEWTEEFATNVTGAMSTTKSYVLSRIAQGGCIVLIASTAGTRPSPGWCGYAASKAALINFGLTIAAELAPAFRVYVLAPGRCATALRVQLAPDEDPTTIMQPDDVARVVELCIEDTAGVLAGQLIEVKRRP